MAKFFCADCNQSIDDVVCPVCGSPAEDLRFDEGTPNGHSDRYGEDILMKSDAEVDVDEDDLPVAVASDDDFLE